jgi:hypothetical protein
VTLLTDFAIFLAKSLFYFAIRFYLIIIFLPFLAKSQFAWLVGIIQPSSLNQNLVFLELILILYLAKVR